ncbi:putative transmembrane protein [Thiomonas sp. X19]|nr:putative transmembrane protein [Thiomonas sp. X19]
MDTHNKKLSLTAAEARLGYQVAARLTEGNEQLPADIAERLKGIRHMVVDQHRLQRARHAHVMVSAHNATATLGGPGESSSWRLRLGLLLAIPTLLFGLYALQHYQQERFVRKIADIDTALLLDNLPPQAYVDPGFTSYLRQNDG